MLLGGNASSSGSFKVPFLHLEQLESRNLLANVVDGPDLDPYFDLPSAVDNGYEPDTYDPTDPLPVVPYDDNLYPYHDCPNLPPELCLPGDLDGNGAVDFTDYLALSDNFGVEDASWQDGDLDGDGLVSMADFLILSANFGDVI